MRRPMYRSYKFGGTGRGNDTRALLMAFGLGSWQAQMAAQSIFFIPRTTDPDAQVTIMLVNAVQYGLQELGAPIRQSGELDTDTVKYLIQLLGPNWHAKSFAQILDALLSARAHGRSLAPAPAAPVGEYVQMSGYPLESVLKPFEPAAASVQTFYIEHPIATLAIAGGAVVMLLKWRARRKTS